MEIELIQRANNGPCVARVFDESLPKDKLVFVSDAKATREEAIAQAEAWAIRTLGHELPVSIYIEILPYTKPNKARLPRELRRGHDPAYGVNRPLTVSRKSDHDY